MRGTVAKALRRQARATTEGNPAVAYLSRGHVKEVPTTYTDKRGVEQKGTRRITTTEVRLDPDSTKGKYRELKRARKTGFDPLFRFSAEQNLVQI